MLVRAKTSIAIGYGTVNPGEELELTPEEAAPLLRQDAVEPVRAAAETTESVREDRAERAVRQVASPAGGRRR